MNLDPIRKKLDGWFGLTLKLVAVLGILWALIRFGVEQADAPFHSGVSEFQHEAVERLDDLHKHALRVERKQERADQWERCRSAELADHGIRSLAERRCDEKYPPVTQHEVPE